MEQITGNFTPLKFNMEPENQPLEKEIPNLETIIFRFHVKHFGGTGCVVEPTHLQNMLVKLGSSSPRFGVNIKNV